MRRDVKKYLFVGVKTQLELFFKKAQEAGLVHFIDPNRLKTTEIPPDIQQIMDAIKTVASLPEMPQEHALTFAEADPIAKRILQLRQEIDQLQEESRTTKLEMARIHVFGHFSLEDIAFIERTGRRKIQFFFAKQGIIHEIPLPEGFIFVSSQLGLDYFISINSQSVQPDQFIEMRIDHALGALEVRYQEMQRQIHEKEQELKGYAKYHEELNHALIKKYNDHQLENAKQSAQTQLSGALFAVEGWVPKHRIDTLHHLLHQLEVKIIEISIEPGDIVPTYLENKGASRLGEDLTKIYDTPSHTDRDPSPWILLFFSVFFAMIIGDGGYGLIYLAVALFIGYKTPKMTKSGKRIWKLSLLLCSACIVWGLLTTSFFAIKFHPDHPIRYGSLTNWLAEKKAGYHFDHQDQVYHDWVDKYPDLKNTTNASEFIRGARKEEGDHISFEMLDRFNDGVMMELALLMGIIHICFSFLRYADRNPQGIGWIICIIGGYLAVPQFLQASSMTQYLFGGDREMMAKLGLYLIYGGVIIAVGISLIKNKLAGLLELTNSIQVFADVLSYLRLYALGLAGAVIGATINDIAGSFMFFAGLLLMLFGHGLNMGLSIIGGVIHGLRLNFIEWYHYCFEGGGKEFKPLRKVEIE